jgi:O-antigen/teichoic acid export membrane protein
MMLTQAISTSLFPQISQCDAQDATDRIESVLPTALLPGILLVIPAIIGTIVLSRDLLRILFGSEFTVAWLVLIILSGEKLFQSLHSVFGSALQGIDRPDLDAYSTMASAAVNLTLNIILVWQFGIVGAAIATTVASAVLMIFQLRYLRDHIKIKLPIREAIWSTVSSLVMGVSIYGLQSVYGINSILNLVIVVVFGATIYAIVAFTYRPIRTTTQRTLKPMIPSVFG